MIRFEQKPRKMRDEFSGRTLVEPLRASTTWKNKQKDDSDTLRHTCFPFRLIFKSLLSMQPRHWPSWFSAPMLTKLKSEVNFDFRRQNRASLYSCSSDFDWFSFRSGNLTQSSLKGFLIKQGPFLRVKMCVLQQFSALRYRIFISLEKGKFVFQKSLSESPCKPDRVSFFALSIVSGVHLTWT